MSKLVSSAPIGRPPSRLVTPIEGSAARRQYKAYCQDPWNRKPFQEKRVITRGTPATRARQPQLDQAKIHHNSAAPAKIRDGKTVLRLSQFYAELHQCNVCLSWTHNPAKRLRHGRCNLCKLVRPTRIVLLDKPDVEYVQRHAALTAASAAQLRLSRYQMICRGAPLRNKRKSCIKVAEFFLLSAEKRDEALAPAAATPEEATAEQWVTQLFRHGERYIGFSQHDYCKDRVFPGTLDELAASNAPDAQAIYDLYCDSKGFMHRHKRAIHGPASTDITLASGSSDSTSQNSGGMMPDKKLIATVYPADHRASRTASAEFLGLEITSSLRATGMCDVLLVQSKGGVLQVQFSVLADKLAQWTTFLASLLATLDDHEVFIGQQFLMVKGKPVAPWLLRIEVADAPQLPKAVMNARKSFLRVSDARVDEPKPRTIDGFLSMPDSDIDGDDSPLAILNWGKS